MSDGCPSLVQDSNDSVSLYVCMKKFSTAAPHPVLHESNVPVEIILCTVISQRQKAMLTACGSYCFR